MAASAAPISSCPSSFPSFAVVCSFLERYGAALNLPDLTFPQLEGYIMETSTGTKYSNSRGYDVGGRVFSTVCVSVSLDVPWVLCYCVGRVCLTLFLCVQPVLNEFQCIGKSRRIFCVVFALERLCTFTRL